jgi:hypothetical protein
MRFAWIAQNEAVDEDGFYLEDGTAAYEAERAALKEMGAPDTEAIQFISILPEDRDEAMVEAEVSEAFAAWAKSPEEPGSPNAMLPWYDETGEH